MDLRETRVAEMIQKDERSKWLSHSNHNIKCFTEGEIGIITSNYEAIIGKGGFGEVYKGVLEDGSTVAVKRFMHNIEENFAKELKVHSEINHKNVVRLIGYCAEENALMIITEYISKGNLGDVLHHDSTPMVLDTRLRIAVECSEALCYMHSQMYTQVIHGDIKPANILLDGNFSAKLSDFGISRLVNTDTALFTEHVIGSIGYMDPLFARYGRLTPKSDVYSFGIVLLELLTKKKATIRKGEIGIVECFTQALATGIRRVRDLFDAEISSQNNMKVLERVAKLAGECLRMEMNRRPEMIDVAERLRSLRKSHVQGKQTRTIFPRGWRNKPAAQNNGQSSGASGIHVPQPFPAAQTNGKSSDIFGLHAPQPFPASQNNGQSSGSSEVHDSKSVTSNLCRHLSLEEMKYATGSFDTSHLVGVGRHGEVYYGMIEGGATKVAIRRCRGVEDVNKFQAEIATMAKLRHHHLVSLVGHCKEENKMVLVYEYMARGTLRQRLYAYNNEEPPLTWTQHGYNTEEPPLTWKQRLDVCIGVAQALHYLHECSIIHDDLTTTNILLDERLVAKVSRAVLPLQCYKDLPMDTFRFKTPGYIDPEFHTGIEPTEKTDVYSLGVVLFEVLCARHVLDYTLPGNHVNLVYCALECKNRGILDLLVDPYLDGKIAPLCFDKFTGTAAKCVAEKSVDRPSMAEVLQDLEMCLAEQRRGFGDDTYGEDRTTSPSMEERRRNLEMYLSEESGTYDVTLRAAGNNVQPSGTSRVHVSESLTSNLCRQFSLEEMKSATGNYDESHLVGVGRSGNIFHGMIDGGATKVAIKRRGKFEQDVDKFQAEIATTAELHHHHLVSLIGYCKENDEMILIYDYMAGGTLRGRLYGYNMEKPPLTWRQRLDVCICTARALHYLHERSIIHCDLTTKKILLDERLVTKVSLPRVQNTMSWGSIGREGYLDEIYMTSQQEKKSDVYSFGVVLFEVLCARAAWDPTLPRNQVYLVECALNCKKKGILDRLVDPYLEGKIAPRCFNKFVETADRCVATRRFNRPSMAEVLQNLELCLEEQGGGLGDETYGR